MSAIDDYLQLVAKGAPLNNQWQQLKHNISQNIPSTGDLQNPAKMQEWATSAALNAPMMGSIKGLDPNRLLPEEYTSIAPKLTKAAQVAHFVRGNNAESVASGGAQLSQRFIDKIHELIKTGVHKDSLQASELLDDAYLSPLAFNDMAASSILQLPKPTYVTREWPMHRPMHDPAQDSQLLSARVVDPAQTDSYKEHYWGTDAQLAGPERSFIYKVPSGTTMMHPGGLADDHEALFMGQTLRNAKRMGIAEYLAYIAKHGAAPFAIGGLGLGQFGEPHE